MTGHDARLKSFLLSGSLPPCSLFASHALQECLSCTDCLNSKRISDLLVGVEHDADGAADGSGWQVLGKLGTHEAALSVGGGNLAPDSLVVQASLGVLCLVDESDALAMVPDAGAAVLNTLDVEEAGIVLLAALSSLESHKDGLGVKSTRNNDSSQQQDGFWWTYLTGSRVCLDFDFVSIPIVYVQSNLYVLNDYSIV